MWKPNESVSIMKMTNGFCEVKREREQSSGRTSVSILQWQNIDIILIALELYENAVAQTCVRLLFKLLAKLFHACWEIDCIWCLKNALHLHFTAFDLSEFFYTRQFTRGEKSVLFLLMFSNSYRSFCWNFFSKFILFNSQFSWGSIYVIVSSM